MSKPKMEGNGTRGRKESNETLGPPPEAGMVYRFVFECMFFTTDTSPRYQF